MNIYNRIGVAIDCFLLQPVEKTIQINSCSCSNLSSNDLNVWGRLITFSSADTFHESQTTSPLANARFFISTPGVARNLYNSWVSVIIMVRVQSFLSVSLSHTKLRHSLAGPRLAALGLIASLSNLSPTLPERFYITLFVGRDLNPVGIATSL